MDTRDSAFKVRGIMISFFCHRECTAHPCYFPNSCLIQELLTGYELLLGLGLGTGPITFQNQDWKARFQDLDPLQYRKGVELGFHFKCLSNWSNVQPFWFGLSGSSPACWIIQRDSELYVLMGNLSNAIYKWQTHTPLGSQLNPRNALAWNFTEQS